MNQQRIDLEEKIAYLEKLASDLDGVVQDLNRQVRDQGKELGTLRRQYEAHLSELHEPEMPGGDQHDA